MPSGIWTWISVAVAIAIALVIVTFALIVAWKLLRGQIDLTYLLAEPPTAPVAGIPTPVGPPKASISRFQFLIFTFVIAGVYLVLCLEAGRFVEIPENVILLLGVSGTSYAASRGITAAAQTSQVNAQNTTTTTTTSDGQTTTTGGTGQSGGNG
jgi:hypothetical protein